MTDQDEDPTFYEMLLDQSVDSRRDRFVWKPGDLIPGSQPEPQDEEERDHWEQYWDQKPS